MGLRLLLINYEYPPLGGGAGNATANIATQLAALGAEVLVLTSGFGDLPAEETGQGFTIRRVPVMRRRIDRCTPAEMMTFVASGALHALRIAKKWRPAACIAFFGIPCGPIAMMLKRMKGVPYVVSLRGGDVPGFQPYDLASYHRILAGVIRWLWKGSIAVVANSRGLQELALKTAPDLDIRIIPNGVDTDRFKPVPRPETRGKLTIGFVGRLTRQKGVDLLLEAFALMPERGATELRLAGDGPERPNLEALAKRLGVASSVRFEGWKSREELPDFYNDLDIFVLPSRDEGMANVLLEAMACGKPVIASDVAGSAELVIPGVSGELARPNDVRSLADALARLAEDLDSAARMGQAGRSMMEKDFSWRSVAQEYLALVEQSRAVAGRQF